MRSAISFEFFPPKTPEGFSKLKHVQQKLSAFSPDWVSVTFGALGSDQKNASTLLCSSTSIFSGEALVPHISCVNMTKKRLIELLLMYRELSINKLIVVRGDAKDSKQLLHFKHASDLIVAINELHPHYFEIKITGYPECHPDSPNLLHDLNHLRLKSSLEGVNEIITQYFFSLSAYNRYMDDLSEKQITTPVRVGLMPIYNLKQLIRFSSMCGATIPRWLLIRLERYEDDPQSFEAFSADVLLKFIQQLKKQNAHALHFYTLNRSKQLTDILTEIT